MMTDGINSPLAKDLLVCMGSALENGDLTIRELPYIASFILSNIDYIYTQDERYAFLIQLTRKWPWFNYVAKTHLLQIDNPDNIRTQVELLAKGMQLIGSSTS